MNIYQRQIFGLKKGATSFNTEIGGVSATISSASALATKLGISSSRVADFTIVGSDIKCNITGGTYTIPANAFLNDSSIIYYNDVDGLIMFLGSGAFRGATMLASITMDNLITIGLDAFFGCSSMTSYSFPSLVTVASSTIGFSSTTGVFRNNTSLVSFSAPNLTTITGYNAFRGLTSLTTFYAPSLTNLNGGYTWLGCLNLSTLTVGLLTYLGDNEFNGCAKITSINLSNVASISGTDQFRGCVLLTNITNLNSLPSIPASMFYQVPLTGAISANSATTIGLNAFYGCTGVTSYSFNSAVTITSAAAFSNTLGTFRNNTSLVSFSAPNLTTINGWHLCNNCGNLTTFYTPLLTTLGVNVSDNATFNLIKTGATITVAASLATVNAGAPDGDLVYASGTRGATIVYV